MQFTPETARTWVEIDLGLLKANISALQKFIGPNANIMPVLKSNAYGHGAIAIARATQQAGVMDFSVVAMDEALELRDAGIRGDIYPLAPLLPEEAEAAVRADLIPFISHTAFFEAFADAAKNAPLPARCFLTLDSGLGREGMFLDEAKQIWERAKTLPQVRITGLTTHFASADAPDRAFTDEQIAAFMTGVHALSHHFESTEDGRSNIGITLSVANSPAILRFPLTDFPAGVRQVLVRPGGLLYGIEPYPNSLEPVGVVPILTWKARIALIRDLQTGTSVGYSRTHFLTRPTRVATLSVGYYDGLSRRLSNLGTVLVNGQRFPIIGRVSMDQCQIDITNATSDIVVGSVATIIGEDGAESQSVLQIAQTMETTTREPTTRLSRRVVRLYKN
jgi:alanine racemase